MVPAMGTCKCKCGQQGRRRVPSWASSRLGIGWGLGPGPSLNRADSGVRVHVAVQEPLEGSAHWGESAAVPLPCELASRHQGEKGRKGAKKLRDVPRSRARGPRLCSGALTKARGRLRVVSCSDFVVWLAWCPSEIRAARRQSGCRSWGARHAQAWFVIRERVHSKEGPAREDGGRWKMEEREFRRSNRYYVEASSRQGCLVAQETYACISMASFIERAGGRARTSTQVSGRLALPDAIVFLL
ncbi:hypothetical protein C8Q73DRAFT_699156 [Cubamyces lactineus]|nr:hypothetical protein C8Q73DRAFT_699156 [Cubamyces lactineus]